MPEKKDFERFPCCGHQHFGPCATNCPTCIEEVKAAEKPQEERRQRDQS